MLLVFVLLLICTFIYYRLLVQMEETEKVFDAFWEQFSGRLKQCHSLRSFEESFNIVQVCYT